MSVPFKKTALIIFITAFLIFVVVLLSGTISADDAGPSSSSDPGIPVRVVKADSGELKKTLRLNGYVQSDNIVTVIPFVSGTLEDVRVKVGDSVQKDDIVAVIDSRAYELQLKQAEAAYFGAKSSFERVEQLYNSNAATRQNYDQTRSQYEAYKSQYELARLQLSYTRISAPISGTVLMIHSNKGSIAAPELPVLTIGDLGNLIVKLDVPDKYYETFRTSSQMNISIIRPKLDSAPFSAAISGIAPVIDAETRNFKVTCSIQGDLSRLRPGMFVYCIFETDVLNNAWYLPHSVRGPGGEVWYVDRETSTAARLMIENPFMNSEYFAVPPEYSGLDYIIEGQSFLQPGRRVNVR